MKIRTVLLAEASNMTPDGKQNFLGVGVRVIYAPNVPFNRSLTVFLSGERPNDQRADVPLRLVMKAPRGSTVLLDTVAEFHPEQPIDERLPLVLNVRTDLARYTFRQFGVYEIVATMGGSRQAYRFAVDERPIPEQRPPNGQDESTVGE